MARRLFKNDIDMDAIIEDLEENIFASCLDIYP